jgi:hypothetical protein
MKGSLTTSIPLTPFLSRYQRGQSALFPVLCPDSSPLLLFLCVCDGCREIQKELPSAVRAAFRVFDSDDNKFIDPEEFRSTLKVGTRTTS